MTIQDCPDCVVAPDLKHDVTELCTLHWIAIAELGFLHSEGHEACCDAPGVRKAIERYGREAVHKAVDYMPYRQQDARRVLAYIDEVYP